MIDFNLNKSLILANQNQNRIKKYLFQNEAAAFRLHYEFAFVLTERLSNISNSVDENRVKTLLKHFPQIDKYKVQKIYNLFIAKKLNLKTAIDIV